MFISIFEWVTAGYNGKGKNFEVMFDSNSDFLIHM
jgi:hypothetical protein